MKIIPRSIETIAVFRALQLGDLLCSIPAIRALRTAFPDAQISLLGLPWAESFVKRFSHYFDRFIHFPGYPGLPEQDFDAGKTARFMRQMNEEKFDLLLQMQGNGTIVNKLMFELGARQVAGFYNKDSYIDSGLFIEYPEHVHEIERHLALVENLGIAPQGKQLEFPFTEQDHKDYNKLFLPLESNKYVCIHPGSRGAWRQWPPRYFAWIADYCIEQGYTVVITGTKEESDITAELIKYIHHPVIDLTGKTSLGAIGILIQQAFLLVSNCTGVSHIAAATETPSIVLSMDGEPGRWGPLNRDIHKVIDWTKNPQFDKVLIQTADLLNTLSGKKANSKILGQ
jgi:ADP-heptose:LPS heptosyltransferase